jgi:hypothetical protein
MLKYNIMNMFLRSTVAVFSLPCSARLHVKPPARPPAALIIERWPAAAQGTLKRLALMHVCLYGGSDVPSSLSLLLILPHFLP